MEAVAWKRPKVSKAVDRRVVVNPADRRRKREGDDREHAGTADVGDGGQQLSGLMSSSLTLVV
jgi:hypothetical protein